LIKDKEVFDSPKLQVSKEAYLHSMLPMGGWVPLFFFYTYLIHPLRVLIYPDPDPDNPFVHWI
jgi:hypothetical protein